MEQLFDNHDIVKKFLYSFLELNPQAIGIFDSDGHRVQCNKAFEKMFGSIPPKEYSIWHDPLLKKIGIMPKAEEVLKKGGYYEVDPFWYNPSKAVPTVPDIDVCMQSLLLPIMDFNNKLEYVVNTITDITDLMTTQQKLKASKENLILLNKELEQKIRDRTKKLKESEEKYKEAYNRANLYKDIIAHDINNILQNIKSSAELSSLYLNSPEKLNAIKEFNVIINEQVTRGSKLINNVQKLSHIDESKITLNPVEVCINIKESIKFVQKSLPNRNINISVDSFPGEILVLADNLFLDVF